GRNGPATAAACDVNGAVGAAGRAGAAADSATSTSISTTGPTRATRAHRTRRTDAAPPVDVGTPRCPPGSATPRACRSHPGRSTVRPHAVDGSQPCGQRPRTGAGMVGAPASSRRSTPAGRASPSTRRGGTMEARSDGEGSPGMAQGGGAAKVVLYVVLGVIAVVVGIKVLTWLVDAVLTAMFYALVIGAVVAVTMLVVRAARRS